MTAEHVSFRPSIIMAENDNIKVKEDVLQAEPIVSFSPQCGNGNTGSGSPGERQVNDPAQDTAPGVFPHITQSETTIAAQGTYIIFGFNDTNNRVAEQNSDGIAFSSDSGVTWCDCEVLPKGDFKQLNGDPVTAVDKDGIFYYAGLARTSTNEDIISVSTGQVNSTTKFLTMNNPIVVGIGEFSPNGFQDKEWIAIGPDGDPDRAGNEALFVTWTDFNPPKGNPPTSENTIRFSKYSTGLIPSVLIASKTIVPTVAAGFSGLQGSFPVVDSSGNLYVFYSEVDLNAPFPNDISIKMLKSTDGGINFGIPITIASQVTRVFTDFYDDTGLAINVEANQRVIRTNEFPHAYAAPDGTLFVVWNDSRNKTNIASDIYLAYSINGGDNWTTVQVTDGNVFSIFPSVAFNCDKSTIQYTKFLDPQNIGGVGNKNFALFKKSFSLIDGLSSETIVSTVPSPVPITRPNFDTVVAPGYMGDYNQIITGVGNAIYHAWGDNRTTLQEENNPDVFFIQTNCREDPPLTRGLLNCFDETHCSNLYRVDI